MKTLFFTSMILFYSIHLRSQCNITNQQFTISSFNTNCSNYKITGSITNEFVLEGDCGDLRFTSPHKDIKTTTATLQIKKTYSFSFYPNPVMDYVQFFTSDNHDSSYNISIYNILGKQVYQSRTLYPMLEETIDLSSLSPGTYYLKVLTDDLNTITRKLIKL